jgi:hypothetical protein
MFADLSNTEPGKARSASAATAVREGRDTGEQAGSVALVFHGSFGFLFHKQGVLASTPNADAMGHVYRMRARASGASGLSPSFDLISASPYTPLPVDHAGSVSSPSGDGQVLIPLTLSPSQVTGAKVSLSLPLPDRQRTVRVSKMPCALLGPGQPTKQYGLVHIFEYDRCYASDINLPVLSAGSPVYPDPISSLGDVSAHIHLYAEPPDDAAEERHDPQMVLDALTRMYPGCPTLTLATTECAMQAANEVQEPDFVSDEFQSLAELSRSGVKTFGVTLRNCIALYFATPTRA